MYWQITLNIWTAGLIMLIWHRILTSTNLGKLSWPFLPLERFLNPNYNSNVKFFFGFIIWLFISLTLSFNYWWLVESSYLTYYSFGSALLFGWLMWLVTIFILFPILRLGVAGRNLGSWVWFESLAGWLIFGLIFGLLIS